MAEDNLECAGNTAKIINNDRSKWLINELNPAALKDNRLHKRFYNIAENLWSNFGSTIPTACQDWANTKAAYRFVSNPKVTEDKILEGHFQSTKDRVSANRDDKILILQDTTEFCYHRAKPENIGHINLVPSNNKNILGKPIMRKQCGILMHSSLVITTKGLPLGLAAIKFWTRAQFKGTNALKKHINPTRMPIEQKESYRWLENLQNSISLLEDPSRFVHIGDRESDIYELFAKAHALGTNFLVRICADRLINDGESTIAAQMQSIKPQGIHTLELLDKEGNKTKVELEIKYCKIKVEPPVGKQKKYPSLNLSIIYAEEITIPKNRDRILWKLATNLEINSIADVAEKLYWYSLRWRIETFHKILKSGCKAEEIKLRTAERITNLIAIFCILAWRIFWMSIINRCSQDAAPEIVFTDEEINLIDNLVKTKKDKICTNISDYIIKVARLGGYLARKSDPPPRQYGYLEGNEKAC